MHVQSHCEDEEQSHQGIENFLRFCNRKGNGIASLLAYYATLEFNNPPL